MAQRSTCLHARACPGKHCRSGDSDPRHAAVSRGETVGRKQSQFAKGASSVDTWKMCLRSELGVRRLNQGQYCSLNMIWQRGPQFDYASQLV